MACEIAMRLDGTRYRRYLCATRKPVWPQFDEEPWPLDRLALTPVGVGADLQRLGLLRKGARPR